MVCIISEPEYINDVWGRQKYDGLISMLKKRRIRHLVIEKLIELKDVECNESIIVIAIGTHR